jgi:hypothetical protein
MPARGLQPASAFASTRAANDFARFGCRELKRRERRAPVQGFKARTVSGNSLSIGSGAPATDLLWRGKML